MTSMEEWHIEEDLLRKIIKKKSPNHPILNKIFCSTYDAIDSYNEAIRELNLHLPAKTRGKDD